jgi:hypothetical protein
MTGGLERRRHWARGYGGFMVQPSISERFWADSWRFTAAEITDLDVWAWWKWESTGPGGRVNCELPPLLSKETAATSYDRWDCPTCQGQENERAGGRRYGKEETSRKS